MRTSFRNQGLIAIPRFQWARREKQIENVMDATMGMWGDLQGISGKSLPEIESLDALGREATNLSEKRQASLPGI